MSNVHNSINYIELPLKDLEATKLFYSTVFQWQFTDWGEEYISFTGAGVEGGFNGVDPLAVTSPGVLIVLFSNDLEATLAAVKASGMEIVKPIYPFPGGRRFHFYDPNGNELAVWSAV